MPSLLDTEYGIEEIDQWLPRLHVVVLGPGLGRNQSMLGRISIIIEKAKFRKIPIVVDADGLWHLATNPSLLQGMESDVTCSDDVVHLPPQVTPRPSSLPTPWSSPAW